MITVAELIAILEKLPQDAKVRVEADYGTHQCEGAVLDGNGYVYIEIG